MWTDTRIRALKPKQTRYRLSEQSKQRGAGRLVMDVQPSGIKTFYFKYFRDSKRILVSLGRYRQSVSVPGLTLSEARERANEFGGLLQKGIDVEYYLEEQTLQAEEKRKQQEASRRQGTLEQLLESYLAKMIAENRRSHGSVAASLKRYVQKPFPELMKRKASEIEAGDIKMILARMINRGVTTHTNRVRSYLHAAFQHGLKQDNNPRSYTEGCLLFNLKFNPVTFIPKQTEYERAGDHVISEEEIRTIWNHFPVVPALAHYGIKLAFATAGQRLGELLRIPKRDVNLNEGILIINHNISKNKKDHVIPLGAIARGLLAELMAVTGEDCQYLFPACRGGKYRLDSCTTSTSIDKEVREFCADRDDIRKFIPRDIRRTVKTLMGKAGIPKTIRDRLQNHAMQDVSSKHYDRYDYLPEKWQAIKTWNHYLELVINPRVNVTVLKTKRA